MKPGDIRLQRLGESSNLFNKVADMHIALIHGGVLPLLGRDFLARLYREIAVSPWGSVDVALQGERVVGFVAGTANVRRCAMSFSLQGYVRMVLAVLVRSWRREILRKVFGALAYPFSKGSAESGDPTPGTERAELLAIAVNDDVQGQGIGRALVQAFEEEIKGKATRYFVSTNVAERGSNAFYRALGFSEAGKKPHHELMIQIYVKEINEKEPLVR
jgi:ribosomal protein S18 acetylase RimI-like enzyme